jgi:hypothetical protein
VAHGIDTAAWWQAIFAAEAVYKREKPFWDALERAADGDFPALVPTSEGDLFVGTEYAGRFRSKTQIDINLIGRALRKRSADYYDRSPSLKFITPPTGDDDVKDAMERLAFKLAEEGGLVYESRRSMLHAHTRGVHALWPMFVRSTIRESEIVAGKIEPGAFIESVLAGNPVEIPLGAPYEQIAKAVEPWLSPMAPDGKENATFYGLEEWQRAALIALQTRAAAMARKSKKAPHPLAPRAKIYFEATPYGPWCLVDPSVTDYSRVGWIDRIFVQTPDEFKNDPMWTDEAKAKVRPAPLAQSNKGSPVIPANPGGSETQRVADVAGRIRIHEIWDKVGWRRFYLADGYDGVISKDTSYPYMDLFGRPLFPDFFPCVWRTPWDRMTEEPVRVLGLPGLEPMWAPQMAAIISYSAYTRSALSTARVFLVGPGIDQSTLTLTATAQDATFVKLGPDYDPKIHGKPGDQFSMMEMPPAPLDYLSAYEKSKREAYESVHLSTASMTASPQAETATQESLIDKGASSVEDAIRSCFEDAYAEAAWKALLMFLEFANPQEFQAYLGAKALEPRPSREQPQVDEATGEVIQPPPLPSVYEAMTETDLVGERLEARFASSTRSQDSQRILRIQDTLATANNIRDAAGMPLVDLRSPLRTLFKESDMEVSDYKPSEAEMAMAIAASRGNQQTAPGGGADDGGDGGNGSADDRKAGGQRGAPASPGRHTRGKDTAGSRSAQLRRGATAKP